jgi:type IV pilus assembly protein PilY1
MTNRLTTCQAILATCGLMWCVATQATDIAELPLKTSLLAKPNVIFGLDDSGSMDAEVMLPTNDGALWWNYTSASGWGVDAAHPIASLRAVNSPHFNAVGDATTTWRKFIYLFPNGTGTGQRTYGDSSNDHFAIAPTPQLAFLRSSAFNPLYYNPRITYAPWPPAYTTTSVTFSNANPAAARSHPLSGTATFTVNALRSSTAANTVFTMMPGMRIPAGATYCTTGGCTPGTASTGLTVPAGSVYRANIPFWPATYWVKESCELDTSDTSGCTNAPNGDRLKRYEIRPDASFPSGRSYADEMQNFANWFTYYRKRKLMLSAAMGETMESLTGMRLGVAVFNSLGTVTMYDTDATSSASNGRRVAGIFYQTDGSGGTPTRATLTHIGEQYRTNTSIVQYACQRNTAFIVTDGFANASGGSVPSYSQSTWATEAPYLSIYAGSLADIALSYYTINLRPSLTAGRVETTPTDRNTNLHMNTYGLTMGARGTLWDGNGTPRPTSTSAWPNPDQNRSPTSVDDLWHATINGRGQMYTASTPEETAQRIRDGLNDILSQVGAQSSFAVSSINLDRGDRKAYLGSFNPAGWIGDLTANAINVDTAAVSSDVSWSAATLLRDRDWTTRVIVSHNGSTGVDFTAAHVGAIVNPSGAWGTDDDVVNYLRGSRAGEGTLFRTRGSLIGPVINAEPVISRTDKIIYVASGEGMLHAFDTETGREHWAYVPPRALPNLGRISSREYTFRTKLDATPAVGKLASSGKRLLVAGLGGAARGYYALDVTSPRDKTAASLAESAIWQFPSATDSANLALMGFSYGVPVIAKTSTQGDVVLVTSGYDNGTVTGDGKGRMWMLNATTGEVLRTFVTTDGSTSAEAGLTHVSGFRESDGTVRHVYGGDLLGNVWHFDLDTGTTVKLAVLKDAAGNNQPVTAAPELVSISGKRVLLLGTGRLLDITDFGGTRRQSFYAIADKGATLTNARTSLVAQTYTRGATPELTGGTVDWSNDQGWYFDLPAGEHANTMPAVAYGAVGFTTNMNNGNDCTQSSYAYLVNVQTGQKTDNGAFTSVLVSNNANSSRLSILRVSSGQLVGTSHTTDNGLFRRELSNKLLIQPAKNVWREIRR